MVVQSVDPLAADWGLNWVEWKAEDLVAVMVVKWVV
jgi:hypothetical protein